MTAPRLYYLADARREVLQAFDWYFDRSPQAAAAFLHELDHAAALIAEAPDIWPQYERETRRYVLRKFPFSMIYRTTARGIEVVAVAHQKKRPGYWHLRPDA